MKLKEKIYSYLAILFFIAIIISYFYQRNNENIVTLEPQPEYLTTTKQIFDQDIDTNYPQYSINKYLPYYSENNFFTFSIFPSFTSLSEIDIFLTNKNPNDINLDSEYNQTKQEILNWIISKGTLISNLQINFYYDNNNQKILIEQINQSEI